MKTAAQLSHEYLDNNCQMSRNKLDIKNGFIAGYESATPKWVSVDDDLPDTGFFSCIEVIARCGSRNYVLDFITNKDEPKGKFYLSLNYPKQIFEDLTSHVTHWMPLPSPPKTT